MLQALSAGAPLVLAIDDVQWLDRASERALAFAVRRLPPRVSLLLTRRADRAAPLPLGITEALPPSSLERIDVTPLTVAALHHLILANLRAAPFRPMLLRIASASGGTERLLVLRVTAEGDSTSLRFTGSRRGPRASSVRDVRYVPRPASLPRSAARSSCVLLRM